MNHDELVASIIVLFFFFRRATNGLNGAISHFGSTGHQTPSIQKAYLIYRPCFASRNIDPLGSTHFHGTNDWVLNGSLASLHQVHRASSQRRISVQRPIAPGRACQTILLSATFRTATVAPCFRWFDHICVLHSRIGTGQKNRANASKTLLKLKVFHCFLTWLTSLERIWATKRISSYFPLY